VIPARYPLRAALEQRRALVEQSRRALGDAIRVAAAAEARRQAAAEERAALAGRCADLRRRLYDPDPDGRLRIAEVARRTEGLRHREEDLDAAGRRVRERAEEVARAEEAVAGARERLLAADREAEVVEKHLDDWRSAERREASRREERLAAEVVQARHAAARAEDDARGRATEEP
jgi:hypothetical protein